MKNHTHGTNVSEKAWGEKNTKQNWSNKKMKMALASNIIKQQQNFKTNKEFCGKLPSTSSPLGIAVFWLFAMIKIEFQVEIKYILKKEKKNSNKKIASVM